MTFKPFLLGVSLVALLSIFGWLQSFPAPVEAKQPAPGWCVWYADNIALKPVMVGACSSFEKPQTCDSYPGGGMKPIPMRKVPLVTGAQTRQEAVARACGQFANIRRVSASSTFMYTEFLGARGGETHDLDELNGCLGITATPPVKPKPKPNQCDTYCPICGLRCTRPPHWLGTRHICPTHGEYK